MEWQTDSVSHWMSHWKVVSSNRGKQTLIRINRWIYIQLKRWLKQGKLVEHSRKNQIFPNWKSQTKWIYHRNWESENKVIHSQAHDKYVMPNTYTDVISSKFLILNLIWLVDISHRSSSTHPQANFQDLEVWNEVFAIATDDSNWKQSNYIFWFGLHGIKNLIPN